MVSSGFADGLNQWFRTMSDCVVQRSNENYSNPLDTSCGTPGSVWRGGRDLRTTSKYTSKRVGSLLCSYCDKAFVTRVGLDEHVKKHQGIFRYRCEECQKGFQMKEHYEGHLNMHLGYKAFTCSYCQTGFHYRRSWKTHEAKCAKIFRP